MKLLVDEMPCSNYECPFSKAYTMPLWNVGMDVATNYKIDFPLYECTIVKKPCDLGCSEYTCNGLKVLKTEE